MLLKEHIPSWKQLNRKPKNCNCLYPMIILNNISGHSETCQFHRIWMMTQGKNNLELNTESDEQYINPIAPIANRIYYISMKGNDYMKKQQTVWFLRGLPGSGKTHWAKT